MTHKTAYDPENIFAKIIRRDMSCTKIYEDDAILAFMDIFPQSEGHALVVPKKARAVNFFDIDPDALQTLIVGVQKVAKAVRKALNPDGMRIIQFNGSEAGQSVFHIHFHIVPVYAGRPLKPHGGEPADSARLQELASKIAAAI